MTFLELINELASHESRAKGNAAENAASAAWANSVRVVYLLSPCLVLLSQMNFAPVSGIFLWEPSPKLLPLSPSALPGLLYTVPFLSCRLPSLLIPVAQTGTDAALRPARPDVALFVLQERAAARLVDLLARTPTIKVGSS